MTLIEMAAEYNISITPQQQTKLEAFAELVSDANRHMNLTRITLPEEVKIKHLLDSLLPLSTGLFANSKSLLDIGAGAGFPSTPLAIAATHIRVTQLDALQKRVSFLSQTAEKLGLNITAVHGRAEEYGKKPEYRAAFDLVTARAVTTLNVLCELCLPFLKIGGHFIALKGPDITEELTLAQNAIKTLGGEQREVIHYSLPDKSGRSMIIIRKTKDTPDCYPRSNAKITKSPL